MATWFQRVMVLCAAAALVSACATYQNIPVSSSDPSALRSKLHRGQSVRVELEGGEAINARVQKLGNSTFKLANREIPYVSVVGVEAKSVDYPETARNVLFVAAATAVFLVLTHIESEACDDYVGPDDCYN